MHAEPAAWNGNENENTAEHQPVHGAGGVQGGQGDALQALVRQAVETYLNDLGEVAVEQNKGRLYELLLHRVELPLLQAVLAHVQQNQTRAARILGLNRGTLRKKMQTHGLLGR